MASHRETLEVAAAALLDAIGARDTARIAGSFAVDARMRMLLPGGLEQREGPSAIADQFAAWYATADPFDLLGATTSAVVDRFQLSYRARLGAPEDPALIQVIEQHGFGDASAEGIHTLDLVCSGFRPVVVSNAQVHVFDAGTMGCTDGLASEFRRRILAIPGGDTLRVIVQDPSAKEDLPPLARMLGHTIQSIDTLADGRVQINVERGP